MTKKADVKQCTKTYVFSCKLLLESNQLGNMKVGTSMLRLLPRSRSFVTSWFSSSSVILLSLYSFVLQFQRNYH